ncbi:MAG: hypothetical protein ACI81R_000379 [Bradymonadia bacterium]|jgi:hypothetical protein
MLRIRPQLSSLSACAAFALSVAALVAARPAFADPPTPDAPAPDGQRDDVGLDALCADAGGDVSAEVFEAVARSWRSRVTRDKDSGDRIGRRVALSAGHGINPDEDSWDWQRGVTNNVREDVHTNQWMIDYIIPMLQRAGFETLTLRERSYVDHAAVGDNDDPETYAETGDWTTGSTDGFGGSYRFASPGSDATATWTLTPVVDGMMPIYVYWLSAENHSNAATFTIEDARGERDEVLDMSRLQVVTWPDSSYPNTPPPPDATRGPRSGWRYVGEVYARAQEPIRITLSAATDGVVIADAVWLGGGLGTVLAGNGQPSGQPRWAESALAFTTWLEVPTWMQVNDVSMRPLYAMHEGVDAYFSVHTNCCDNSGTSTWTWFPDGFVRESAWPENYVEENLPPGTYEFSDAVHDAVIAHVRASWDPDWDDEGHRGADFGEIRALRQAWIQDVEAGRPDPVSVPGFLMELAYHDTAYDASLIREEGFRYEVARGILAGFTRYFDGADAPIAPRAPSGIYAATSGDGVVVRWTEPRNPTEANATPDGYRVYTSSDGLRFELSADTTATSATIDWDDCVPLWVRVTAYNGGGESLDSREVIAQRAREGGPRVLVVDGVDREVRQVTDPAYDRRYIRRYLDGIDTASLAWGIDSATDDLAAEALAGRPYDLVIWALGESSTRDRTLGRREHQALEPYLAAGGAMLVSGAEIGWDMVQRGRPEDRAFFEDELQAMYVTDDAGSTVVEWADVSLVFGDCTGDAPCIEFPDVLAAAEGGEVIARYATGAAAIVSAPDREVWVAGFPLESIVDAEDRAWAIGRAVDALVPVSAVDDACEGATSPPDEVALEDPPEPPPVEPEPDVVEDVVEPISDAQTDTTADAAPDSTEDADDGDAITRDVEIDGASEPSVGGDGGCGCHAGSTAAYGWGAALILLLLGRRRRGGVREVQS